jgi:hypothetical protein
LTYGLIEVVFEFCDGIIAGLVLDGGQAFAFFFAFGLDDADWFSVYEQDVVGRAHIGLIFPNGHARRRGLLLF